MSYSTHSYHTLVIGAGQAGLSAGYYLKKAFVPFLIIESNQAIGQNWQQRYDSLVLFTPAQYSSLPGHSFPAPQEHYPTKDEIASYLSLYAELQELPIRLGESVVSLQKQEGLFRVKTTAGDYWAHHVIVATGAFAKPFIPVYPGGVESPILQMHSSQYRNPGQLPPGPVLVVGGGNSGAQIAVELSGRRQVGISVRKTLQFKPLEVLGKSIFWWGTTLGIIHAPTDSFFARRLRAQGDPIYGLSLKYALEHKTVDLCSEIHSFSGNQICFIDGKEQSFDTVVWSTGFMQDWHWIDIPELYNAQGQLRHRQGITSVAGLYFLGLPWQRARSSVLIMGAGRDAEFITSHLLYTATSFSRRA